MLIFAVPEVTRFTFSFNDLLEGLRKYGRLTVTVYYSNNIHIQIRKGKREMVQSPEEARFELQVVFSLELHEQCLIPQQQCVTTYLNYCQLGELIWALMSRVFLEVRHVGMAHPCDWPLLCSLQKPQRPNWCRFFLGWGGVNHPGMKNLCDWP